MDNDYEYMVMDKCDAEGQPHSVISKEIYANLAIGTKGYSAQETVRNFLYQYTNYNEQIALQCIPIYYIDVNRRITVKDKKTGINGDYIINSITLPLSYNATMSISATRALNRLPMTYQESTATNIFFNDGYMVFDDGDLVEFYNDDTLRDNEGRTLSYRASGSNEYLVANARNI